VGAKSVGWEGYIVCARHAFGVEIVVLDVGRSQAPRATAVRSGQPPISRSRQQPPRAQSRKTVGLVGKRHASTALSSLDGCWMRSARLYLCLAFLVLDAERLVLRTWHTLPVPLVPHQTAWGLGFREGEEVR
jgi:hypothetical protein